MATRRSFLAGLGIGLFSAAAAWADPPRIVSAPAAATDAVDTVRQYLTFRATSEWTKAYALLSRTTQAQFPFDQFTQVTPLPADLTAGGMTPSARAEFAQVINRARAVFALFINTGNTLDYKYQVVGIAPEDPHTVLVSAQPLQAGADKAASPLLLRLVTAPDPQTGASRIEMEPSLLKTDPVYFEKAREKARLTMSLSNLKQISLAMIIYVQDHDEKYPAAERWVDAITPYLVGTSGTHAERERALASLFHDPTSPDSQKWSYAFNSNLSGLSLAHVDSPATTVCLFESNAGVKNAADTGESIPRPGRHSGGTDYAFADGRSQWFSDKLSDADRRQKLSFSPTGD